MKHLKTFESYTFEDFTHADMEDVKDLLDEGLTAEEIAVELDFDVNKVKQIIYSLKNSGESLDEAKESGVTASLKKKSKASGIPLGILRKVFSKGMQAWNAGHRPGVAQHQWGMGRVNSFITGAGGARKADANLWTKAKAAKARKKKKK
jgi:DNA-binding CsgD family transcriptional regulator